MKQGGWKGGKSRERIVRKNKKGEMGKLGKRVRERAKLIVLHGKGVKGGWKGRGKGRETIVAGEKGVEGVWKGRGEGRETVVGDV
jgi:hypothetical protein